MSVPKIPTLDPRHDLAGIWPSRTNLTLAVAYSPDGVEWTLKGDAGLIVLTARLGDESEPLVVTDERGQILAPEVAALHYGRPASTERPRSCDRLEPCFMHSTSADLAFTLLARWATSGHRTETLQAGLAGTYRTHLMSSLGRRVAL